MRLYRDEHSLFVLFAICSSSLFGIAVAVAYIGYLYSNLFFIHNDTLYNKLLDSYTGVSLAGCALAIWMLAACFAFPIIVFSIRFFLKTSKRRRMVLFILGWLTLAVISFFLVGWLHAHSI